MTPAAEWLDDPSALCVFLRDHGLRVGTGEALRISSVLYRLGQRNAKPRTANEATLYLAPLVCTNAAQQALLPRIMAEFASLHVSVPVEPEPPPPPPAAPPPPETAFASLLRQPLTLAAASAAVAIAAIVVLYLVGQDGDVPAPVDPELGPPPPRTRTLERWNWPRLAQGLPFAILPVAVWLLFFSWYRRRPVVLQRARTHHAPDEKDKRTLADPSADHFVLFGALELRRPLQAMRAHRLAPSTNYDFAQSVRATARAGGFLTLVPEMRPMLPEYPLIIEQLSGKDHVAALGRALAARLVAERVAASMYTFNADPRLLRGDARRLLGLGDIFNRHGDETIIIVSDGEALIDSLTGAPNASAIELLTWTNPVLLTPLPLERWSRREHALAEAGLLVLPATPEGLEQLALKLAGSVELRSPALRLRAAQRSLLSRETQDDLSWHHDEPMPSPQEREEILDAIAAELPAAAFELLCVLARFPEVRLDLTLHMGLKLKRRNGNPLLDEASFGALAWLPWMRLGRLPDWLRLDLTRCLSDKRREEARILYERWLEPALAHKGGDHTPVAFAPGVFDGLLRRHAASDKTTPLRDVIFLKSQRREEIDDLDLRAPDALRRLLRPRWFDPEWIGGAIALALAIAAFAFAPQLQAALSVIALGRQSALITLACACISIPAWHLAAYLTRWQTWLSAIHYAAVVVLLGSLVLINLPAGRFDTGFVFILTALVLPPYVLALFAPTAGPPETAQPERTPPIFPCLLLAIMYAVIALPGTQKNPELVIWVWACGALVLAFLLTLILALPYLPIAAGTLLGALSTVVLILPAVTTLEAVMGVSRGNEVIDAVIVQMAGVPMLYGGWLAAVLFGRIRLTRFLLIAGAAFVAISLAAVSEGVIDTLLPRGGFWSTNVPVGALCLILAYVALVRPQSTLSRPVVRGCFIFLAAVTTIDYLAGIVAPFLASAVPIEGAERIGPAAQFLFVPGAIAAILAALGNAEARQRGLQPAHSVWRAFIEVYRPPAWLLVIPILWLCTLRFPLPDTTFALPLLFIPAAAYVGATYGTASRLAVLLGGLPFLADVSLGRWETINLPGIYLAGLFTHQLFADLQFRTRAFFADYMAPVSLIALVLLLASTYRFAPVRDVAIGGTPVLALSYVLFVIGASRIPPRPMILALLGAGFATLGLNYGLLLLDLAEPPVSFALGFSNPREILTAIVFFLLGRFFFNAQLPLVLHPEALRPDEKSAAIKRISAVLIGGMVWLVFLSHVEIIGAIGGRLIGFGILSTAIVHALAFLLGFSFGARGLLLAAIALIASELVPSLVFGSSRLTLPADLQLRLNFPPSLDLLLSRVDDLAFALVGWRLMLALRPAQQDQPARAEAKPKAA